MARFDADWMRKDAKLTLILLEAVCVSALLAYSIKQVFGIDLGVSDHDAAVAALVGAAGGLIYFAYSALLNAVHRSGH